MFNSINKSWFRGLIHSLLHWMCQPIPFPGMTYSFRDHKQPPQH